MSLRHLQDVCENLGSLTENFRVGVTLNHLVRGNFPDVERAATIAPELSDWGL